MVHINREIDNYYVDDLIDGLKTDVVVTRYLPLVALKEELRKACRELKIERIRQMSFPVIDSLSKKFGEETAILFARFCHAYDFHKSDLYYIRGFEKTPDYENIFSLIRLPRVRQLRARQYNDCGYTLESLCNLSAEEVLRTVKKLVLTKENKENLPTLKEIRRQKEVSSMILKMEKKSGVRDYFRYTEKSKN